MSSDADRSNRSGIGGRSDESASVPPLTADAALIDRHVLVVEDEPRLRQMLIRALIEMELEPGGVGSAEAALRELEEAPRGILLVDLDLPGMPGIDLCEQVRRRWPATQMIILTGHGDLDAARTAMHLDVVDFLTKPCSLGELESSIDRALRRRRHGIVVRTLPVIRDDDEDRDDPFVSAPVPGSHDSAGGQPSTRTPTLQDLERVHILAALDRHDGNRRATADELGISVRTLYYRLKSYGWRA